MIPGIWNRVSSGIVDRWIAADLPVYSRRVALLAGVDESGRLGLVRRRPSAAASAQCPSAENRRSESYIVTVVLLRREDRLEWYSGMVILPASHEH